MVEVGRIDLPLRASIVPAGKVGLYSCLLGREAGPNTQFS